VDIPDICNSWHEKIKCGNDQEQRILGNLCKDNCINSEITDVFFNRLAAKGDPDSPEVAKNTTIDIVWADPDRFVCQGEEIPSDSFEMLFRLEDVKKLGDLLPDDYLCGFGIRDLKTFNRKELTDDELSDILHRYKGELDLGNKLDVVWVADNEKTEQIDPKELVDRLGLDNLENEERCLKIGYKRDEAKKPLHLPRCFDGINQGRFEVVEDCNADAGKTAPLSLPREQGLPEAVHRGCKVTPEILVVEPIE